MCSEGMLLVESWGAWIWIESSTEFRVTSWSILGEVCANCQPQEQDNNSGSSRSALSFACGPGMNNASPSPPCNHDTSSHYVTMPRYGRNDRSYPRYLHSLLMFFAVLQLDNIHPLGFMEGRMVRR